MGGPRLFLDSAIEHPRVAAGPRNLGDKLQELARRRPSDLRALEALVNFALTRPDEEQPWHIQRLLPR